MKSTKTETTLKKISVTISGTTPLIMDRFPESNGETPKRGTLQTDETPRSIAEKKLYLKDGKLFQPAEHLRRGIGNAAKELRMTGRGKKSWAADFLGGGVMIYPLEIPHLSQEWEVDQRPTVNQTTKARILNHRPRLDKWALKFDLEFDSAMIPESTVREAVDICGRKNGLGALRPQNKGVYGQFRVDEWNLVD